MLSEESKIYDKHLSERGNGVVLIGGLFPMIKAGAHFIFFHASWRNAWANVRFLQKGWQFENDEMRQAFSGIFDRLYSFIWERPMEPQTQDEEKSAPPEPPTLASKFNLKAFLQAPQGYVPNNEE